MASLEALAAQAAKDPYQIELGGVVVASVPHPTLRVWQAAWADLAAAPAVEEIPAFLVALGVPADAAQAVGTAVADMPFGTSQALITDMRHGFGLGN